MDAADVSDLFAIYGDPEVMRYASDLPFSEPATVLTMLESVNRLLAAGASLEWGIEKKPHGHLIGTVGLHSFEPSRTAAEVGCLLVKPAWGQGYMREALHPVMNYARDELGLKRLVADMDAANTRSIRLFESLGFCHQARTIYECCFDLGSA